MEFLSATILSGVVYDLIKHQVQVTAESLKEKLRDWVIDEAVAPTLATEIEKLELNDEMSEKAIERQISESTDIQSILSNIVPNTTNVVIQHHSGTGDNIGGNKIIR
jgi:Na+-translocating ferredoxin:NAD+ oxidoreductase RnfG subunit